MSDTGDTVRLLQAAAVKCGHRRLLVCSGNNDWCRLKKTQIKQALSAKLPTLIIGASANNEGSDEPDVITITANQCLERLGGEFGNIIFDAHAGFDVDAFGAISGTLCAGGLLVLLTPPLDQWHHFTDPQHRRMQVYPQQIEEVTGRYLQRLAQMIERSAQLSLLTQQGNQRLQPSDVYCDKPAALPKPYKTDSQLNAVAAVHKVLRGHRRRPLVLTADRGRGKTAALGIAAAQLLLEGVESITVTAPSKRTLAVLFRHAHYVLGNKHADLHGRLLFVPPDELVRAPVPTPLLLVDEAAAIPTPLLEKMLDNHSRVVFATTIHGYEGTGRGFAIRFKSILDHKTPNWRELHMNEPIRWRAHDPLESFVFAALLLNASPSPAPDAIKPTALECREISQDELLTNDRLLKELFGLLVLAHYQTRPFDLRHLLDGGNIEIYGLFEQRLVAVVLAAREGNIEPQLSNKIWLGERRVRGHLLPQSLSNHLGVAQATELNGLRIIRIAVHPDCHRRGIGRHLLNGVEQAASKKSVDYLGTVFGATADLLHFWCAAEYTPSRLGVSRDAASGTHSVMMLKGLSADGQALISSAQQAFIKQLQWLLMDELQVLESDLVAIIYKELATFVQQDYALSKDDLPELFSYCHGRQYENCIHRVKKAAFHILANGTSSPLQQKVLVQRVLQNHSWQQVAKTCGLSGEKQVRECLRTLICNHFNLTD